MKKGKVIVGMSGGVDSSAATYLLKEQGYDVIGVTMRTYERDDSNNYSAEEDAKRIAEKLDIPYYIVDFQKEFKANVIDYFVNEYRQGRTPNPCIVCNRYVKWEALLYYAKKVGADYVATGHYARIEKHPVTGRYALRTAAADRKDQTYALYNLTQEQLQATLMPIGEYEKDEIRKIAGIVDKSVSQKADSQEICFIPDDDYCGFIEKQVGKAFQVGDFVDLAGNKLGKHQGIVHYTVGQRKGLGVSFGKPMFVYKIDAKKNEVILCDNESLFQTTLFAGKLNFMAFEKIEGDMRFMAKIRYNHKKAWCTVKMKNEMELECVFDEPQRAVTPGQAVVFYDGDFIAFGGTILESR